MNRDKHLDELLGAFALDAVDDVDRLRIEVYLAENPEARAEVWEMRQAAAMLAHSGNSAPAEVWGRIAASLEEPPPRRLNRRLPGSKPATRRRAFAALLAATAIILIAGAGLIAAIVLRDGSFEREAAQAIEQAYEAAWADPDGRRVRLASEDGALRADAVIGPDGVGFVAAAFLPELPSSETYQLWGIFGDGDVISLGVVGNRPGIEPFAAAGELDALAITREVAGGVVAPTSDALLVGEFD